MGYWDQRAIGIAGAGLMGRLLALELSRRGASVTLFDADDTGGERSCGAIAAGMLAPYSELERAESLILQLGLDSLQRWPQLLAQLAQPVYFQQAGTLVVAHVRDVPDLRHFTEQLQRKIQTGPETLRPLDQSQLQALEPALGGRFYQGVWLPHEGHVSSADLYPALTHTLRQRKVKWHTRTPVQALTPGHIQVGDAPLGETPSGRRSHRFDWVIDCRGLGAQADLPKLRGMRGEVMLFHAPEVKLTRPVRLMHPRYRLYVVPRPNDIYVIGATEIDSQDLSPISVRSSLELLSAVYSLHPGFAEARILATHVNCRPLFPDNLPRFIYQPGLLRINGLYRHGYLIGPALLDNALQLLQHGPQALSCPALLQATGAAA